MNLGSTSITALYLGSTAISTVYLGSTQIYSAGGAFSPLSLFSSGEEGAWYEPSPTSTFTDIGGYTFATYGQTVSHLIDKSQGATIEARRNLLERTEEFDDVYWGYTNSTSTSASRFEDSGSGDNARLFSESVPGVSVGSAYVGQLEVKADGYDWILLRLANDGQFTGVWFNVSTGTKGTESPGYTGSIVPADDGYYKCVVEVASWPSGTNRRFGVSLVDGDNVLTSSSTGSGVFIRKAQLEEASTATAYQKITDGQTVSWLPGNHATQTSLTSRPILARVPVTGRRNLLTGTDDLATQSVTVTAVEHVLSFYGTGTVTLTGASTAGPLVGTGADDRVDLTFTPSAGSLTLTVSGDVNFAQLEIA